MSKGRLEAFSDGVLAIILTIMVLELHIPAGDDLHALRPLLSLGLAYVLSFVNIGIYWNNHHHMLQATRRVNGKVLLANLHLLFWLSLVPFGTGWVGQSPNAPWPTAFYGTILFLAGIAYLVLQAAIVRYNGPDSVLAVAIGGDFKGWASGLLYLVAVGLAFVNPHISQLIFVAVAVMWFIPDTRIERVVAGPPSS